MARAAIASKARRHPGLAPWARADRALPQHRPRAHPCERGEQGKPRCRPRLPSRSSGDGGALLRKPRGDPADLRLTYRARAELRLCGREQAETPHVAHRSDIQDRRCPCGCSGCSLPNSQPATSCTTGSWVRCAATRPPPIRAPLGADVARLARRGCCRRIWLLAPVSPSAPTSPASSDHHLAHVGELPGTVRPRPQSPDPGTEAAAPGSDKSRRRHRQAPSVASHTRRAACRASCRAAALWRYEAAPAGSAGPPWQGKVEYGQEERYSG
jgi:hypothetical protein